MLEATDEHAHGSVWVHGPLSARLGNWQLAWIKVCGKRNECSKMRKAGWAIVQAATFSRYNGRHDDMESAVAVDVEAEQHKESSLGKTPFSPTEEYSEGKEDKHDKGSAKWRAPEQDLTLLALRLAVLEKLASLLGTLAFVWATVVLLGGFVSGLETLDFWVIAALLLTEGTRVFSRSQELEWQHAGSRAISLTERIRQASSVMQQRNGSAVDDQQQQQQQPTSPSVGHYAGYQSQEDEEQEEGTAQFSATSSRKKAAAAAAAGADDVVVRRTWSWASVPFIPFASFFVAEYMSLVLYMLQLASAVVSIAFSLFRLCSNPLTSSGSTKNMAGALNVFYALVLAEASIFLVERAYWEYKISWRKLVVQVNRRCNLGDEHLEMIKQFFYDVYSRCVNASVFEGLDMDLVGFSLGKLESSIGKEQLGSALILSAFVAGGKYAGEALRRIGTTPGVIDRLLEMLTWKNDDEKEVRRAAALIVRDLACYNSNGFRIAAIAGALEGIVSLIMEQDSDLRLCGLRILLKLTKDHRNCVKVGNTRGLTDLLVSLIELKNPEQRLEDDKLLKKKALQLLKALASTTGESGHQIRIDMAKRVFLFTNLCNILHYGRSHPEDPAPQELALAILVSLGTEDSIRESIGGTGGLIRNLLELFLRGHKEAGHVLNLLVVQSPRNCKRILRSRCSEGSSSNPDIVTQLVDLLYKDPNRLGSVAANILYFLCEHLNEFDKLTMADTTPFLLEKVVGNSDRWQDAVARLAAATIELLDTQSYHSMLEEHKIKRESTAKEVMKLLALAAPSTHVPGVRRHALMLATALMTKDELFVQLLREEGLQEKLDKMLDTTSNVENFYTFSGTVGLTSHSQTLEELIEIAVARLNPSLTTSKLYKITH